MKFIQNHMSGFDRLLAKSLSEIISKKLGTKSINKIENRLFEKFGISFTQSMEQFDKLDIVLREFFGRGADGLEKKFFESVFSISSKSNTNWIVLSDSNVNSIIVESFGDSEKKCILESVNNEPKSVYDIIETCNLAQTSGYRKVNSLIDVGLLVPVDYVIRDNKKIPLYHSIYQNLRINVIHNKITIEVQLNDYELKSSSVLNVSVS